MPRKPVIRSSEHFYHVTARSNNKETFFLPLNEVWFILNARIIELQRLYEVKIGAFVLMNNHFHLLIQTPAQTIDRTMYYLMKTVTVDIQKRSKRINKIFGGRYKASLINSEQYFYQVYQYIYLNPVRAGIAQRAEDYYYSTLYDHHTDCVLKTQHDIPARFHDRLSLIQWLNNPPSEEVLSDIKRGLRKTTFSFPKDRSTGKERIVRVSY